MKSLNIKIPLRVAQLMDDCGQLNPMFVSNLLKARLPEEVPTKPVEGLAYNYTMKVDNELHYAVKLKALEHDIAMNELVGRWITQHYERKS